MKIAFFGTKPYDKIWFSALAEDYGYTIHFLETKLNEETVSLAKGYDAVCAFVNDELTKKVINELVEYKVKGILMRCAGYNNVDLEAAKGRIPVLRVPSYSPEAVAEFAIAMYLTINRKTHKGYNRTREFNMNINGLMGQDLYHKTAGIIGTGKIGQAMIKICKGFGMRVLAYDVYENPELDVEYTDLDTIYEKAHMISLHCPLTKDNYHMIQDKSLKKMRDGVYIINTSRGALIKTSDLLEALLKPGKIGGVGMDVYEEEGDVFYEDKSNEIMRDDVLARLVTFPNVLITSHQGYFTKEAMQAIAITTMENAYALDKGLKMENEVVIS